MKYLLIPLILVFSLVAQKKPNIIFIMVDDLGKEWVSTYGADDIVTPNLDAMAEKGLKFHNAYSMPKCTPSRATVLTGTYPFTNGWVNHWDVPRWSWPADQGGRGGGAHFDWKYNMTFARVMKSAGYVTAAAGKWQLNDFRTHPDAMVKHGFDEYAMWTGAEMGNPESGKRYWDAYIHSNGVSKVYTGEYGPDLFLKFIIDFMGRNVDKPQMIYYPMALTHAPLTNTPHTLTTAKTTIEKHIGMVEYTDYIVGQIINAADSLGIDSNTIIIFTTDNGSIKNVTGSLNGRLIKGGKSTLGENGVCEPFIAYAPGLVPVGETDLLTDFSDMLPTFAELAGVNMDTLYEYYPLDGHSIAKTLLGQTPDFEREWIMAMGGGIAKLTDIGVTPAVKFTSRIIRDKQFKVVTNRTNIEYIYDLQADPAEENNLISSTDPEILAALVKFNSILNSFPQTDARPVYDLATFEVWPDMVVDLPRGNVKNIEHSVHKVQDIALSFQNGALHFFLPKAARLAFQMYDMSGKKILNNPAINFLGGFNRINLADLDIKNGIYVTQLKSENKTYQKQIILMRR